MRVWRSLVLGVAALTGYQAEPSVPAGEALLRERWMRDPLRS